MDRAGWGAGPPALGSPEGLCCPVGAGPWCGFGEGPVEFSMFSWLAGPDGLMVSSWCPCVCSACTQAGGRGASGSPRLGWQPWSVRPAFPPRCSQALCPWPPAVLRLSASSEQRPGRSASRLCLLCPWSQRYLALQGSGPCKTLPGLGGCSVWKVARWQRQPGVCMHSAWVMVRQPSPPRSVTTLVSPFQLPGPRVTASGL